MAARILNFILKYGFIDEQQETKSIYTKAQRLYSQLPAINLNTGYSIFRKDTSSTSPMDSPNRKNQEEDTFELEQMDHPNDQIKLKKVEEFKEDGEEANNNDAYGQQDASHQQAQQQKEDSLTQTKFGLPNENNGPTLQL